MSAAITIALLSMAAQPSFRDRGVYFFEGDIASPVADIGSRPPNATNRLALDDDHSDVQIDQKRRRIVLTNRRPYKRETVVADFMFLGNGRTKSGRKVTFGVHLKVSKKGNKVIPSLHAHPTTRDKIMTATFSPYSVMVDNGRQRKLVLTEHQALQAVREPETVARLANSLIHVVDNLEGLTEDVESSGYRITDISLGPGRGVLSKMVINAKLVSLDASNAPLIRAGSLAKMLGEGKFELRLTCLSHLLVADAVTRDLFLLGLDEIPLLRDVMKHGLRPKESLSFVVDGGQGSLQYGGKSHVLPDAANVVRSYLEFHFLGAVMADKLGQLAEPQKSKLKE